MPLAKFFLVVHLLLVLAFLLFFALKAALLFTARHEALRRLRARTRIVDSGLGILIVVSGAAWLGLYPGSVPGGLWSRLLLGLVLLPLAIAALRRQHKLAVALTLAGLLGVYAQAAPASLALHNSSPQAAMEPAGQAEAGPTPNAAAPVDTTDMATSTGFSEADAAAVASASEEDASAAPTLAEGKALFQKNCAVCHGPDGKLGLNGAHDLSKSNLNTMGRVYMVTQGLGKMPSFKGQLSEVQIQQVVAYSLTLQ